MMGKVLSDPHGVEAGGSISGMGLLPAETIFEEEKTRTQAKGKFTNQVRGIFSDLSGVELEGYEIHMGQTELIADAENTQEVGLLTHITELSGKACDKVVGMCCGNIYGSYIHGIFDKEDVAKTIVSALYRSKGLDESEVSSLNVAAYKEMQYDKLAEQMRANMDMNAIYRILEEGI